MFVAGIFVGPLLGLLVGYFLFRSGAVPSWLAGFISALVLLLVLVVIVVPLEFRLGVVAGYLLGLLLTVTPFKVSPDTA